MIIHRMECLIIYLILCMQHAFDSGFGHGVQNDIGENPIYSGLSSISGNFCIDKECTWHA